MYCVPILVSEDNGDEVNWHTQEAPHLKLNLSSSLVERCVRGLAFSTPPATYLPHLVQNDVIIKHGHAYSILGAAKAPFKTDHIQSMLGSGP